MQFQELIKVYNLAKGKHPNAFIFVKSKNSYVTFKEDAAATAEMFGSRLELTPCPIPTHYTEIGEQQIKNTIIELTMMGLEVGLCDPYKQKKQAATV